MARCDPIRCGAISGTVATALGGGIVGGVVGSAVGTIVGEFLGGIFSPSMIDEKPPLPKQPEFRRATEQSRPCQ